MIFLIIYSLIVTGLLLIISYNGNQFAKESYLFEKGWTKIIRTSGEDEYEDTYEMFIAPDERKGRRLNEAYKRQTKLDEIEELNLPKEYLKTK